MGTNSNRRVAAATAADAPPSAPGATPPPPPPPPPPPAVSPSPLSPAGAGASAPAPTPAAEHLATATPFVRPPDFAGPAAAVKDLFALPYSGDVGVSVAIHKIGGGGGGGVGGASSGGGSGANNNGAEGGGGTLLIDCAPAPGSSAGGAADTRRGGRRRRRARPASWSRRSSSDAPASMSSSAIAAALASSGALLSEEDGTAGSGGAALSALAAYFGGGSGSSTAATEAFDTGASGAATTAAAGFGNETSGHGRPQPRDDTAVVNENIPTSNKGARSGERGAPLDDIAGGRSTASAAVSPGTVGDDDDASDEPTSRSPPPMSRALTKSSSRDIIPVTFSPAPAPARSSAFDDTPISEPTTILPATDPTAAVGGDDSLAGVLPPPNHYASSAGVPPPKDPRQYLRWNVQGMDCLVASDAVIVRPPNTESRPGPENSDGDAKNEGHCDRDHSRALSVRVEDARILRSRLQVHEDMAKKGLFVPDRLVAAGAGAARRSGTSYAEALRLEDRSREEEGKAGEDEEGGQVGSFAAPDLGQVRIVPSNSVESALGEMGYAAVADPATNQLSESPGSPSSSSTPLDDPSAVSSSSSPVCTVLDAYLDNIMANVPQLALCLRDQGLIQSVKLLQTEDLPSAMLHPSTLDVNDTGGYSRDPLFSPEIVEMNAAMLMRFLQDNCTRDNATYLLRRDAGETNVRLYDVSAISGQRQKKWMHWLATVSYRFALQLKSLHSGLPLDDRRTRRDFRCRERLLLENTLGLLEDLADMDGGLAHETFAASVSEQLADTFLASDGGRNDGAEEVELERRRRAGSFLGGALPPVPTTSSSQPYSDVSTDALTKAQDHLVKGISKLWPLLHQSRAESEKRQRRRKSKSQKEGGGSSSSDGIREPISLELEALTTQMYGQLHKLINVSLRLAGRHMKNYFSSSAMQSLRTAARRIADAVSLASPLGLLEPDDEEGPGAAVLSSLRHQYAWLWELCGHFARSFAADDLWRERGHACGDDVVSLLRDVHAACFSTSEGALGEITATISELLGRCDSSECDRVASIAVKTGGLSKLDAIVASPKGSNGEGTAESAHRILDQQKQIRREERRVLVAAVICYSHASSVFSSLLSESADRTAKHDTHEITSSLQMSAKDIFVLSLLRQRLGDACNEIGKMLLAELKSLLTRRTEGKGGSETKDAAVSFLESSEIWFDHALKLFQQCRDSSNTALLHCNLCQCCKMRSNTSLFVNQSGRGEKARGNGASDAETYLQQAIDHLHLAHEAIGDREFDPRTWDNVSEELAATFLVLGVRRRQSLLGGGSTPVLLQTSRLTPGQERSIVEPMESSRKIYETLGNAHQEAAAQYQLALFYTRIWTCQRDEEKTREKLSAAFKHFGAAHAFFRNSLKGNEPTFVILSLDFSSLYSAVSEDAECTAKALSCCLDTQEAFSPASSAAAAERGDANWQTTMLTLAASVEERLFKLLVNLVKIEKDKGTAIEGHNFKDLYRLALTAKMANKSAPVDDGSDASVPRDDVLLPIHGLICNIKQNYEL